MQRTRIVQGFKGFRRTGGRIGMSKRLGLLIVAILMGVMARGGPSALAQMPPNESVTVLQLPAHSPHWVRRWLRWRAR